MEDKATDPGIIKLKLKEEIRNLRDGRRADQIEFMEESQRKTQDYNNLAHLHNEMLLKADKAVKLAATLGSCLAALAAFSALLVITAWLEGTVPLRAGVMGAGIAVAVGFMVHMLVDKAFWPEEEADWDGEDEAE